jgi:hypothetical protein
MDRHDVLVDQIRGEKLARKLGPADQRVELAGLRVRFDLGIPDSRIEFCEPGPEPLQLFRRKLLDPLRKFVQLAHDRSPTQPMAGLYGGRWTPSSSRDGIQPRCFTSGPVSDERDAR